MTMLERYLYAVRTQLPKDQPADDIVAEIADAVQSQIDEREDALGRPLTGEEEAALIKSYGHPRVVASRYGSVQYLIGPDLLPFYWSTLTAVLAVVVAVELVAGAAASLATGNGRYFFDALNAAFNSLVWVFAIVTVVFALGERFPQSIARRIAARNWDPRTLQAARTVPPAPRFGALVEFIANTFMLLVLVDAGGAHHIPLDAVVASTLTALHAALTPAWHPLYVATLAGTAMLSISAIVLFVRPEFSLHELVRGISSTVVLAGIVLTLQAGRLIAGPDIWNASAAAFLSVAALLLLVQIAISVRVLRRSRPAVQP
jgi:hypothetical protein